MRIDRNRVSKKESDRKDNDSKSINKEVSSALRILSILRGISVERKLVLKNLLIMIMALVVRKGFGTRENLLLIIQSHKNQTSMKVPSEMRIIWKVLDVALVRG